MRRRRRRGFRGRRRFGRRRSRKRRGRKFKSYTMARGGLRL